jgi:TonB family protein
MRELMCALSHIALIVFSSAYAWSQTPDTAISAFIGRQLIFPKGGDQAKIKLKKSQLSRLKGSCDVAVQVEDAGWNAGTMRFRLDTIGTASILNHPGSRCPIWQNEIVLELSEFAPNEAPDSLLSSVRVVLQTPEEYLANKGVRFSIPPGAEDEIPLKPPPPIIYPKVLLRVDGAYTSAARSAKRKGSVKVALIVGTDGRAHRVRLMRGLGLGLDESAIKVIHLWRFEPARQLNKEIAVESMIEMNFDIL